MKVLKQDLIIPSGTPFEYLEGSTVDNYNGKYEAVVDGARIFVDETDVEDEVEWEECSEEQVKESLARVSKWFSDNRADAYFFAFVATMKSIADDTDFVDNDDPLFKIRWSELHDIMKKH